MSKSGRHSSRLSPEKTLFRAVVCNDKKLLVDCLSSGTNVNAKDEDGLTPAMWALLKGHREILGFLMTQGIDHSAKDNHGRSIFEYFSKFGSLSDEKTAKLSCTIACLAIDDILHESQKTLKFPKTKM